MALQITVKDINGSPIQGVEVKYWRPNNFFAVDTQITNANGVVTIKNDTWTNGWYYTFMKIGYDPLKYTYENHSILPGFVPLNIKLSESILYFKLYKYNENTHTEEPYTGSVRPKIIYYKSSEIVPTQLPITPEIDGYYHLSGFGSVFATNVVLAELRPDDLTDYGSIFLMPNGFIKKEITNWESQPYAISITENTLPEQKMVFYPNTKRLTKAELRKCVVSNPHLMNDDENDTYCPTNITYSTIYNMIKDSNGRDENYISGVEDVNFYQDKTLTIQAPASLRQLSYCYIDCPGIIQFDGNKHTLLGGGGTCKIPVYYSSTVTVRAKTNGSDYTTAQHRIIMDGDKTLTLNIRLKTFTYVIEKIELILNTAAGVPTEWAIAKITGSWKNNEVPNTLDTLKVAVTVCDPEVNGYLSFKDTLPNCNNGTYQIVQNRKCNSIDSYETTGNGIVHTNGNSFYVVSIFFSSTNIYYQFKNNGYYSGGVFRPYVYPEPTNTPSQPGGGSSWGGGQYTVHVNPNNKSVECDLEDNRGNKKHETITSEKTYNVEQLTVVGKGLWKYSSTESGVIGSPDSDTFNIPNPQDPAGRHIELTLVQQEW